MAIDEDAVCVVEVDGVDTIDVDGVDMTEVDGICMIEVVVLGAGSIKLKHDNVRLNPVCMGRYNDSLHVSISMPVHV